MTSPLTSTMHTKLKIDFSFLLFYLMIILMNLLKNLNEFINLNQI